MASDKHPPVVFDDDNPEWTAQDVARARPIADFPELAAAFPNGGKPRGRPAGSDKEKVSIRLDRDVLASFRADGPGWQGRVNAALRRVVAEGSVG